MLLLIILILFAAYLSFFIAGFAVAVNYVCKDTRILFIIAPAFWVAFEYARAHLFTGFPWELLGYSQFRIPSFGFMNRTEGTQSGFHGAGKRGDDSTCF